MRREDGTRGPLCRQLLRHLFSIPASCGHPPPAYEQSCLPCGAGTGGLTPAWGSIAPASTCLVLAAQRLGSNTISCSWVWGGQQKVGKAHKHFMPAWLAMLLLCCLGERRLGIQSPGMTLCLSSASKEGSSLQSLCMSPTVRPTPPSLDPSWLPG